jgi:TP901 family phage tail tape measure protein
MPLRVSTVQTGLEQSIRKAVKNVNARGGLNIAINDKQFTRPLGKITGSVSEFNKSLEASNARVLAFGASVGIIQGVQRAFASLVTTTIQVEKQLTEINVVMGTTNDQLQKFGDGLFKVARNTAQSFSTVATAATELARQGLSMEETLKRTNDALILTRLTGLDAASAVSGLTAALNTFNKVGLDSTKVLSKMAAVDVQFAVSTEDLIDAVSRAGAVARDAGVSFDELLGAVTAAQQQTARGGKVIGNSFKTIFTRVQRSSTIKRLEELGIAVRDIAGNTLPAIKILTNLSQTYETLADTTKAAVAEQVGGVFQINILKAAIKDLADNNSILARATRISAQATDEAIRKNEILNKTLAAVSSQAAVSIQEFTNAVGSIAFEDNLQTLITAFNDFFKSSADFLRNGEGLGADAARGFIKGFGNIITGPGLILALGVLGKLLLKTFGFLAGSVKELIGIKSLTQQQRDIQKSIVAVLGENEALQKKILSQEGNRAAQEKTILGILQAQSREQAKIASAASAIGPAVMRAGYNAQFKRTRSEGHIPNYVSSSDAKAERSGARMGGYSPGAVKSMNMPGQGKVVYNSAEAVKSFPGMVQPAIMPPPRSRAGRNYQKAFTKTHGFNPYANGGFVPNFARRPGYSSENPSNIAKALIYGKSTAMNLVGKGGKRLKDTFYSFGPAMATGTEMNAIRERIYKKFIQNKGSDFRDQVNASLRGYGGNVPKAWGNAGTDDLVFGMVQQLNSARKSSRKLELPYSEGFVPNFGMRLNAKNIKSIGKAKIRSQNYDGTIGMSELDKILTTGLFKSINYSSKAGNELTYTNARWGVNKYKKGAPPPGDYVSYGQMDKATGTRALFVGSAGKGADAYRRLRLENVRSVVSQGKHLRVDPTMAQLGFIPNFALANTPFGVPYSTGLAGASPANYTDNVIAKYESYKNPAKLNELLKSPAFTLDALKYLDNQGLEKIKQSMLSSGMLGSADWEFSKSGIGKPTTADVSKALKQVPARELFNYLTGQTDRIQGNVSGNFIRLLDHKERSAVAMDMIGRSSVSGVIKNQISSIRKSKNRMNNAQMEALIRDVPRLGYDPNRGITRAKPGDYLRAQQYAPGGLIDQMAAISMGARQSSSSSLRGSFPALGRKVDIQRISGYMDEFGVDSGKAARALGIRDSRAEQAFKAVFGRRRSSGFIPNFAMRQRSTIKATEMGGYGGAPNQVEFVSSVGGQPFTKSMAIVIPDPRNSTKPGLQVINTLDANPKLRGQGYGKELYEYMAGYAKNKGYAALYGDAGTSPSVMGLVSSIGKKGKFKVEKNSDLKYFKDDFDTTGMYASDSWTYRMSNKGFVPSYAFGPLVLAKEALKMASQPFVGGYNRAREGISGLYGAGKARLKGMNDSMVNDPRGVIKSLGKKVLTFWIALRVHLQLVERLPLYLHLSPPF